MGFRCPCINIAFSKPLSYFTRDPLSHASFQWHGQDDLATAHSAITARSHSAADSSQRDLHGCIMLRAVVSLAYKCFVVRSKPGASLKASSAAAYFLPLEPLAAGRLADDTCGVTMGEAGEALKEGAGLRSCTCRSIAFRRAGRRGTVEATSADSVTATSLKYTRSMSLDASGTERLRRFPPQRLPSLLLQATQYSAEITHAPWSRRAAAMEERNAMLHKHIRWRAAA